MSISNPEIKKLYGLAAGRCSICKINVFSNKVHIGEMAHIIAKSTRGPRGNEKLTSNSNSYENLILLCPSHHTEVDQNPDHYTVEHLYKIKLDHEKKVASHFESPKDRLNDISFLKLFMRFVPFTQILYFIDNLPRSVDIKLCTIGDMFEAAQLSNPHLYPLNDPTLQKHFDSFITSYYVLWNIISGFTYVNNCPQANFSQADDKGHLHIEKRYLPYEETRRINELINTKNTNFIKSYLTLIEFIKSSYKEVDLNSYTPY